MDGTAVGFTLAAAMFFAQPLAVSSIEPHAQHQEIRIDGIRVNDVIYFDAPIRSATTVLR